jgi:basic membrane lipoprotein Med (substrate-binding protein (PBP1-ABC) superfamily)
MRWINVSEDNILLESDYYQAALMELGGDTPSWYGLKDGNLGYVYSNIEVIIKDFTKPSEADVNAKITELKTAYTNAQYKRNRKPIYPNIGDQLDDLYKAGAFSDDMTAKIKAVKDKYPKG